MMRRYLITGMEVAPPHGAQAGPAGHISQDIAPRGELLLAQAGCSVQVQGRLEEQGWLAHSHVALPQQLPMAGYICPAFQHRSLLYSWVDGGCSDINSS